MPGAPEGANDVVHAHARANASLLHLVVRHINIVTSAMRTSPRWSQASSTSHLSSATTSTSALSLTRAAYVLASADVSKASAPIEESGNEPASVGLLGGFTVLRAQLRMVDDVSRIPLTSLLSHFISVILSARTSGAVTQVALEALTSFLEHGLCRTSSPDLDRAVQEMAHAASHCRFEPSEAGRDEVVLLSILDVMFALVCGHATNDDGSQGTPLVDLLGDEGVCELMETCLSMCCQTRLSTALRRTAEQKMLRMMRVIFARLDTMPLEIDEAYAASGQRAQEPELATLTAEPVGADAEDDRRLRMAMPDPKSQQIPAAGSVETPEEQENNEEEEEKTEAEAETAPVVEEPAEMPMAPAVTATPPTTKETPPTAAPPRPMAHRLGSMDETLPTMEATQPPFSLPAVREVLRVVISLLDPGSVRHTMTMRILGLSLLNGVLDTHCASLARFPTLRALLEDSACRYLFQLANAEQPGIVAGSLRVITLLFDRLHTHLKRQQELWLQFLLQQLRPSLPWADAPWSDDPTRAAPPPPLTSFHSAATGEMRELFIEALSSHLSSMEGEADVFVSLWRNYDCDLDCSDVYDELTRFLARAIFAQPAAGVHAAPRTTMSGMQLVALDAVLCFVARMTARWQAQPSITTTPDVEAMRTQRQRKRLLADGAAAFNHKPKDGIAFLEREHVLAAREPERAKTLARFLKDSALVDKRLLGDYLSRAENRAVLTAFLDLFDFSECDVAEAMRALCEAFRLPGEAQQIARITETFAHKYFMTKPAGIRSEDAVYVLAYSIIMLNTDLHNPQVTRRMTIADYQRNLRGVNDGQDFDPEYLAGIYDGIRRREIVMPEEHAGQLGFDYTWKELLRRARAGNQLVATTGAAWDRDLFRHSWQPFVASIVHAFSLLQDEHVLQRVIAGYRQCAVLALAFEVPAVLDFLVEHLAKYTGLLDEALARDRTPLTTVRHDQMEITVSSLSTSFGQQFKQQLAAVVVFTMAHSHGEALRTCWPQLLTCVESLLCYGLLPSSTASMQAYGARVPIPLEGKSAGMGSATAAGAAQSSGGGLFSTLSSYFLSPSGTASDVRDVSSNDRESTLCTLDCLASCQLENWTAQRSAMGEEALHAYLDAVQHRLTEAMERASPSYSPTPLFWLDQWVETLWKQPSLLARYGDEALKAHTTRIESATRLPPLEVERAVAGAMRLVHLQAQHGASMQAALEQVLHALRRVPSALHPTVAAPFLDGLAMLASTSAWSMDANDEGRTILHLLTTLARVRRAETARAALQLAMLWLPHATPVTFAPLMELVRSIISEADRALWLGEEGAPRRTLTEKRERSDWIAAVHAHSAQALAALAQTRALIPSLQAASPDPPASWPEYWLPLIAALAQPCVSVHRATRAAAVQYLPSVVLAPEMATGPAKMSVHLDAMYGNILLPLLESLLSPETAKADASANAQADAATPGPPGTSLAESRSLVCLLICKAWVRDVGALMEGVPNDLDAAPATRVLRLWKSIVTTTAKLLHTNALPHQEALDEQLKNMILVMHASGHLKEGPPGTLHRALWVETWRTLDAVRPHLRPMLAENVTVPAETTT
ncbi:GDP/GTP exchange factor for ARF [Malassezia pachydermatis]|uniref:Sec7 domain-containing protein n=1 Tax=Malassezia pachydermatis TaxID=77020 RepID=A0A0N0RSR0_9BASI|nr:sec7 domain-containing protein [Malassezia pachydermatis]KOS16203.1 sec7 domain-containing protein [Malassezia pachydermatis]